MVAAVGRLLLETLLSVVCALIAVNTLVSPANLRAQSASPRPLDPIASFDIPANPAQTVTDFCVGRGKLDVLLTAPGNYTEIVEINHQGRLRDKIIIPRASAASRRLIVAEDKFLILHSGSGHSEIGTYSRSGELLKTCSLPWGVMDVAPLAKDVLCVSKNHCFRVEPASGHSSMIPGGAPIDDPILSFAISDDSAAVIQKGIPSLVTVDLNSVAGTVKLTAPELQSIVRKQLPPGWVEEVVYSAASDGRGSIYCAVSRVVGRTGAGVLQFNRQGRLLNRFRCILPTFENAKRPGDPQGHLLPTDIRIIDGTLFLISSKYRKCVQYALPRT